MLDLAGTLCVCVLSLIFRFTHGEKVKFQVSRSLFTRSEMFYVTPTTQNTPTTLFCNYLLAEDDNVSVYFSFDFCMGCLKV